MPSLTHPRESQNTEYFVLASVLFLSVFLSASSAYAKPSFDCAKATTKVERAICEEEELAHYDSLLATTFSVKKKDSKFLKAYTSWLKERNQCNATQDPVNFCLRKKYVLIFDRILNDFGGFENAFTPSAECFRPLLPVMNGDQGFYSVRVISEIRGCGNLNLNLEKIAPAAKYAAHFLRKKGKIYYYQITETYDNEASKFDIGVRFEKKSVSDATRASPTLVMTLAEAY